MIVLDCFFLFNLYIYKFFLLASSFLLSFQPPFILPFTLLYTFYRLALNLSLTLFSRYYVRHACIPLEPISSYYHPFFPPCCYLFPSILFPTLFLPACALPSVLYILLRDHLFFISFLLRFSLIFFFILTIFCTYLYQISIPLHFPCIFFLSFYSFIQSTSLFLSSISIAQFYHSPKTKPNFLIAKLYIFNIFLHLHEYFFTFFFNLYIYILCAIYIKSTILLILYVTIRNFLIY